MPKFDPEFCREPRLKALLPFFVFTVFYLGLSIWARDFYKVPMTAAFLVASAAALSLDHKQKFANKVEVFARGMGDSNIMIMCLIFILAGAFAATAKGMGAVNAAVEISRYLIPSKLMLAGMFCVSCFLSLSIGTSCGTIAALVPIAAGLVGPMNMEPALMIGAVIGGAMFGDNMSMISDTTIAAARTQEIGMKDKFFANLKMVFPAALLVLIYYVFRGSAGEAEALPPVTLKQILLVTPYLLILFLSLAGLNVMALLFFGTVLAAGIGVATGAFSFWTVLDLIGKGTLGMSETLIVAILAGGLLKVVRYNGGIGYLLNKIQHCVHSRRGCEFGILGLVSAVNLFTANNTVAIVIAGPIVRGISRKYGCDAKRAASILDIGSCAVQGLIPYGAQVLIAVGLAGAAGLNLTSLQIISALYYPWLMGCAVVVSIFLSREPLKNK